VQKRTSCFTARPYRVAQRDLPRPSKHFQVELLRRRRAAAYAVLARIALRRFA